MGQTSGQLIRSRTSATANIDEFSDLRYGGFLDPKQ